MAVKVAKDYGAIASRNSKELKLQKLKDDRLALVSYKDGMSVNVIDITAEARELKRLLEEYLDYKTPVIESESGVVKTLSSLPAGDCNYQTALGKATESDLKKAIEIMQSNGGKNATRIKTCESQLKKMGTVTDIKTASKVIDSKKTTTKAKAENKKVVQFPKEKPEIIPLKTDGNSTYEDCVAKLDKEAEMFTDSDSQYVIDGLKELCKVDQDFRNNLMREEKTYGGFIEYMGKAAQNGYCIKYGNVGWIDRDTGLGLAIDYYNHDEAKAKAEEEKLKKAKTTASKAKKGGKANGKNVRKKKTGTAK